MGKHEKVKTDEQSELIRNIVMSQRGNWILEIVVCC
jgi:hypothetical protein